jgi:hypothetical protein
MYSLFDNLGFLQCQLINFSSSSDDIRSSSSTWVLKTSRGAEPANVATLFLKEGTYSLSQFIITLQ